MKTVSQRFGRPTAVVVVASLLLARSVLADADSAPIPAPATTTAPATTWQQAIEPWTWSFPRDHGAHPDFKTEWWYFTGNLQDSTQRKFGYQLTIFRQGVQFTPTQPDSKWAVRDFYFGHLTISDLAVDKFHVQERVTGCFGRGRSGD